VVKSASCIAGPEQLIVSVVICTYNRAEVLKKCLQSLAEQNVDVCSFEVLVVDNKSTDNTAEVTSMYVGAHSQFRLILEPNQGLSHARNRGWKEAVGSYVAYIDDDAKAYPDWISNIINFIRLNPDVGVFGGPFDAYYLVPPPDWFPPEYGSLNLGNLEREISLGREWIIGLNMVIKKDLFYRYGGFDVNLGMIGGKTAYGEEINFFLSMADKGQKIYYVPSIKVSHLVAEYKMSLKWLLQSSYSVGRSYKLTFKVKRSLLSHLLSLTVLFGAGVCQLLQPANTPAKRRLYYSLYKIYYEMGAIIEHCSDVLSLKKY
jgi:glycosyltransferase involved in cell wall biosynthesis